MLKNAFRVPYLAFGLVLVLLAVALIALPPASRARLNTSPQSANATKSVAKGKHDFVKGQVLVRYKNDAVAKRSARVTTLRAADGRTMSIAVEGFAGSAVVDGLRLAKVAPDDTLAAVEALKRQSDVLYAEPDYILRANVTPNDTHFGDQYGMTKIGAPTAWNTQTGNANVIVGVIDQGIDINHQDLTGNKWVNPTPGAIPGFAGDVNGWNFVNNNGNVFSGNPNEDHGTHVAGIAGAVGNNALGVSGVAWDVSLMSLRFLDESGSGSTSNAIAACAYAKQMRDKWVMTSGAQGGNVRILNNSYGGGGFTQSFLDTINALNTSGILFVAAAGNAPEDPEVNNDLVPHYPSSYNVPNVIAVARTSSDDSLHPNSHYGANSVHLGAPGSSIRSTTPGNQYLFFSGTSMASPHVAGAAALLLSQNPNLTVQQLKNLLLLNGDIVGSLADKTVTGRRLNIANSFAALAENDNTAPGVVTNFQVTSQNGRTFNLSWNASGDDGAAGQAALYQVLFNDTVTGSVSTMKSLLPAASGSPQTTTVTLPYRHRTGMIKLRALDNAGNESNASIAVTIPFVQGDPYAITLSVPAALSTGGTRLFGGPNDDDQYSDQPLPFTFPFFGTNHNTVKISTNGNLYFGPAPLRGNGEADDVPSLVAELQRYRMISGLWDDIDLRDSSLAGAGVYVVQPSADRIIYRWRGVPCNYNGTVCTGGAPINFEIELNSNGTIKSRYGSGNTNIFPVVGLAGGEPQPYVVPSHTSEFASTNLTDAAEVTYIPRGLMNPLDNSYFFATQHYRDFLGREPDLGGLGYWGGQINCNPGDTACFINRRTGVSAAFFIENEFQRTGSFVYRSIKGGLGRRPTYAEFQADRPLIVEGPTLEQTKQAYSLAFVQRQEFVNKYNGQNTAETFVDAMIASVQTNSMINLTSQRQTFINAYNGGGNQTQSRALALRALIDSTAFTEGEYNPSFVVMQYFGYLVRDPEEGGYLFWLDVLNNRVPGNYRGMVCAFITSAEYQQRFSDLVPHNDRECDLLN